MDKHLKYSLRRRFANRRDAYFLSALKTPEQVFADEVDCYNSIYSLYCWNLFNEQIIIA